MRIETGAYKSLFESTRVQFADNLEHAYFHLIEPKVAGDVTRSSGNGAHVLLRS